MSYVSIVQDLPQELQLPMLKLVDAVQRDMRSQLAVRRQDFDELKAVVHELAEAQKRTEQRVEELAEAQKRTEQRLSRLEAVVAALAEAQKRTEQRLSRLEAVVAALAEAQKRTEEAVNQLLKFQVRTEERLARLETRQDALRGDQLERRYRERAYAYLGRVLRRAQAVSLRDIETVLEERLSADEMEDLLLLDVLVRGRLPDQPGAPEVWLAMEVSAVVDRSDVERARRRAALLRKAGYQAIPTAAGEEVTRGGEEAARDGHVFLLQDGRKQFWEEALAGALSH